MEPSDIHIFNKVAKSLSFTVAAREVGSSRSAISKRITRLEQGLGIILLNRNTRSVSLTEAGQRLFQNTAQVDTIIERAIDDIRATELGPAGTVKLVVPSSFGKLLLPLIVMQFRVSWPDVKVNIHVEDNAIDLIAGGYDLAIQVTPALKDSNLISRRLGSTARVLAAAPAYLEQFGSPERLQDLEQHRCLGFSGMGNSETAWRFSTSDGIVEVTHGFPVVTDNVQSLVDAACSQRGIIYVPQAFINKPLAQQQLIPLLAGSYEPEVFGIFAVYPHRNAAAKVRVLVDFIDQAMRSLGMFD